MRLTNSQITIVHGIAIVKLFTSSQGTSTLLGTISRRVTIKPKKMITVFFTVKPLLIASGIGYSLMAEVTDPVGGTSVATVALPTPFISLTATVGAVKPAAIRRGRAGSFTVDIENNGNVASAGKATFQLEFYAVGDTTTPAFSATVVHNLKIPAARHLVLRLPFKIPASLAPGEYSTVLEFTQGIQPGITSTGPTFQVTA